MGRNAQPEPVQPDEAHDYDTDTPDEAQPDYSAELVDEQEGEDK